MVQKQIAFEKTKQQQIGLTLSDISPKWAKRLGEQQQLPAPMSITWLRWWFEIIYPPKCVVGEAHGSQNLIHIVAENVVKLTTSFRFTLLSIYVLI